MTYKALYLSPMIPSFNLSETSGFFKDILNFSPVIENEAYIICQKDNLNYPYFTGRKRYRTNGILSGS